MRKPIMAGNWKMNLSRDEAKKLAEELKSSLKNITEREIIVFPPYLSLPAVADTLNGTNIQFGAQNLFWEEKGAYTGEVSAPMIKALGASHVLIGHSERRQYFGETNETVNKRVFAALKGSLSPIVCVGETLEQREKGEAFKVIEKQIVGGFEGLKVGGWKSVVIAYEPVWAIGTGKTATPEQAQEVHAFIRGLLPKEIAQETRILYGGSVKPDNVKELMAKPDIDGALVGGASLKADDFISLVKF
ncbi:MAG: triosephosphate isomerase (TIM) [Candidatus Saganbacteria bacterium]|uniref:Triosephosphate isomerase n=1 Tax=Candidatus Saganbacteria bacterium TaxID=2575572 RepID=A0A833KZH0_UNCSA|nr:MAG: triosephosphate isomerase (TIM) [Candidatus Saganbacteria bacterium]